MTATRAMPPKKKIEQAPPPPESPTAEKTEFSAAVKLREAFKKKLQTIAVNAGVPMGELIERQMQQFVEGEYRRILEAG